MSLLRHFFLGCIFGILYCPEISSQIVVAGDGDPSASYTIKRGESLSKDSIIDLSRIGHLKIHLRKPDYAMNEVILLDIALWVQSDTLVFVPVDLEPELIFSTAKGEQVDVRGLYIMDLAGQSFRRSKDVLVFKTLKLIVGCLDADDKTPMSILGTTNNKVFMENDLFKTPLEACLNVDGPGEFSIQAEVKNRSIGISSRRGEYLKTLVGSIQSNALRIRIHK